MILNFDSFISHFIYINLYYRNRQVDLSETEVYLKSKNLKKNHYLNTMGLTIVVAVVVLWLRCDHHRVTQSSAELY